MALCSGLVFFCYRPLVRRVRENQVRTLSLCKFIAPNWIINLNNNTPSRYTGFRVLRFWLYHRKCSGNDNDYDDFAIFISARSYFALKPHLKLTKTCTSYNSNCLPRKMLGTYINIINKSWGRRYFPGSANKNGKKREWRGGGGGRGSWQ